MPQQNDEAKNASGELLAQLSCPKNEKLKAVLHLKRTLSEAGA